MKLRFVYLAVIASLLLGCNKSQKPAADAAASPQKFITVDPATAGSVVGTIRFQGAAPKFTALDMTSDPGCPPKPQPTEVVMLKNGSLANVFVYIKEGLPAGAFPVPSTPVELNQKGCRYLPHVLGVMVGQPFKILNSDTADHNIHNLPKNNPQWNESQFAGDAAITKTFTAPEMMLPLECNQHPWMRAYVSVMTHPYFAISAEDGSYQIPNLPPGDYVLAAVHEKFGEQTMKIKVEPKQTVKAPFIFAH